MAKWLSLLAFMALAVPGIAADSEKRAITLEDYFTQANLFDVVISPNGRHIVYVEGRWDQASDSRKTYLWVVDVDHRTGERLTFEGGHDHSPQWSPDSKTIYFLGSRKREGAKEPPYNGSTQVWRVAASGGKPFPVTRVKNGIDLFAPAPAGRSLYYVTSKEHVDEEWKKLRTAYSKLQYGHGRKDVSVLWKLDLQNWRKTKLLDCNRVIHQMSVDPGNRRIALITTPDGKVISMEGRSTVDIFDLKSGKREVLPTAIYRKKMPSPYGWLEHLAWSVDGKRLAFDIIFDAYPSEIIVADWGSGKVAMSKVPRPNGISLRGYGSPLGWQSDHDLCFLGDKEAYCNVYCARNIGKEQAIRVEQLTPGSVVVDAMSVDLNKGRLALIMNDARSLPDVHLLDEEKKLHRVTKTNPQAEKWKLPKVKKVTWKGAGGKTVEGILELPPDYKPGKRLPLIVEIHGGPTTCTRCQVRFWIYGRTLLPSKGYALLSPNYRGSTGYGDAFLTDLVGRENDVEVTDILKGAEAMVADGIADPERLGVMGWSNGGYLTNCLITRTTRFKAASSGASILDTVMEWGSNDEPAYPIVFKTGFPWNRAEIYKKTSPTYALDKVRTPTLIHVGANDVRCPPSHSRMLYRALKEYVKVPTELLVYPGEPHGLRRYSSRKAKMAWDLAWFKKYLPVSK